MQPDNKYLFKYKGCYFLTGCATAEYLDSLQNFEIRDNDVFLVTYPKSGTVWTQNILSLIYHEGHRNGTEKISLMERVPWLEYKPKRIDFDRCPSSRLFASHMPYYLVPRELKNRKGKVIYIARNPKDALVSYYHFSKILIYMEDEHDFGKFMEKFLAGKVFADSWLDHVEGWYTHRDDFNILFLMFEDMKRDLRSSVVKICNFIGKSLTEEEIDDVVEKVTFSKMKVDPRTNYEFLNGDYFDFSKGHFFRKGTIGDWKNTMTVAQSERFDSVFKERMEKLPFKFYWDMNKKK
uniref:Sulfotransferase n=1 Tax=Salvator merianae TaxID=96440 RepID=A0A8D0C1A7_SALMN